MRLFLCLFALLAVAPVAAQSYGAGYARLTPGPYGNLHGFRPFPASNAWNTVVTNAEVDPSTSAWHAEVAGRLHPDFTMPYQVIDSTDTAFVPAQCVEYCDNSDFTSSPIPPRPLIEGGTPPCDAAESHGDQFLDRHGIFVDKAKGFIYEYYQLVPRCAGGYTYSSSTVWDATINEERPHGFTSVDAAGLSVFAGIVKYEEAHTETVPQTLPNGRVVQTLGHAIRFTMDHTKCGNLGHGYESLFVSPATHGACNNGGTHNIMGMRIRLRADFDTTAFQGASLVMANTMKTYGMILADNGSRMYFTGTSDPRWSEADLNALKVVTAASFDIVQLPPVTSASVPVAGRPPSVSAPVAEPATIYNGGCATITWTSSRSSYEFLENGPPSRTSSAVVCPNATTTYSVVASNSFGRTTSASVRVRVKTPVISGGRTTGAVLKP